MNAQQYYKSIVGDRNAWRNEMPQVCMWCGFGANWIGLQVHEVQRRSSAPNRFHHRSNLLLLCNGCHGEVVGTWPHAKQLALKQIKDEKYYDLQAWLRIADPELKAPNRVTQEEVDAVVLEFPVSGNGLRF